MILKTKASYSRPSPSYTARHGVPVFHCVIGSFLMLFEELPLFAFSDFSFLFDDWPEKFYFKTTDWDCIYLWLQHWVLFFYGIVYWKARQHPAVDGSLNGKCLLLPGCLWAILANTSEVTTFIYCSYSISNYLWKSFIIFLDC